MSSDQIISQLKILGLSKKEALVYSALINIKKASAQTVADMAGIKRPTAYLVLNSLITKKLVAVTKFRNVKDYRALPLEHLKSYISLQRRVADATLPAMQKMYDERKFKVRLRVYHGLSDVKTLLEKSLREKSPMHILGQEEQFKSALGPYWEFYNKRSAQLKMAPKFKFYAGSIILMVWYDKVAFVKLTGKVQVFAFKNSELHDMYKRLWTNY